MDEERREVMNILEGRPTNYNTSSYDENGRTSSPAPVVRSMLDIGPATVRHGSIAGTTVGVTAPPVRGQAIARSMLDLNASPPKRVAHSVTTSPTEPVHPEAGHHRAQSDASNTPPTWRPHAGSDQDRGAGALPYAENQFNMSPKIHGQVLPKRVTQGGKKGLGMSSMASIMQGQELEPLPLTRDQGRHNSTAGILGVKSKSPSSRLTNRSQSPGGAILNTNSFNLMSTPGKFVTDGGKVIDMNNAYRRLSDANLLKSGGHLSSLPAKKASERARNGETLSPTGEPRLQKDYYENDEDGEAAVESSEEEVSSDEDGWGSQSGRGRRRARRKKGAGTDADTEDSENDRKGGPAGMGRLGGPKMAHSLMAAAEEERKCYTRFGENATLNRLRTRRLIEVQSQVLVGSNRNCYGTRRRESFCQEGRCASKYKLQCADLRHNKPYDLGF